MNRHVHVRTGPRVGFRIRTAFIAMAALCISAPSVSRNGISSVTQQKTDQNRRPDASGTIRVRVTLVPVDVIVTDENHHPVTDLKQEDFQIFENGRRQQIRHFSLQTLKAAAPEPPPPLRAVPALQLTPQSERTFLIMLGRGRIQTPFNAVDAIIRFVRKDLLPQDRVAVFAYNRATPFTTDHEIAAQVLERYKAVHDRIESRLEIYTKGLAAIYGSKQIPRFYQAEIDKIFALARDSVSRQVPPGRFKDSAQMNDDALKVANEALKNPFSPTNSALSSLESDAITDLPFDEFAPTFAATYQDMQNIFTGVSYMRFMEGEKHLLFFSQDGLFLSRLEYENGLAAYANDARVAIHTFQTGGTTLSASFSRAFAISSLRTVADLTGGRASIRSDIGTALARLNEATRAEYLLGYYPQDENWNGKYRRIEVKVSRPGVRVSFRHGYYASQTVLRYNREEFVALSRIGAAAGYAADLGDVAFRLNVVPEDDTSGPPRIRVDLQVDAEKLGLKSANGIYTGKVYAAVYCWDAKRRYLGETWGTVDMEFQEATYSQHMQSGVNFTVMVPNIVPGQILKVIVYDLGSGRIGSRLYRMPK